MIMLFIMIISFISGYSLFRNYVANDDNISGEIIASRCISTLMGILFTGVILLIVPLTSEYFLFSTFRVGYYEILQIANESDKLNPLTELRFKSDDTMRRDKIMDIQMFVKNFKGEKSTIDIRGIMNKQNIFTSECNPYVVLFHDQMNYKNLLHFFGEDIVIIDKLVLPKNVVVEFKGIR